MYVALFFYLKVEQKRRVSTTDSNSNCRWIYTTNRMLPFRASSLRMLPSCASVRYSLISASLSSSLLPFCSTELWGNSDENSDNLPDSSMILLRINVKTNFYFLNSDCPRSEGVNAKELHRLRTTEQFQNYSSDEETVGPRDRFIGATVLKFYLFSLSCPSQVPSVKSSRSITGFLMASS